MKWDKIFNGLPFGFSSFSAISSSLIDCAAKNRLPKNSQTVISILFPYYLGEEYYKDSNISRYAVSADYHIITTEIISSIAGNLKKDFPDCEFEAFVDNSPIPEVRCAVNAGLGLLGKNGLFISREYGSWVFLGDIVTDMYIPPFDGTILACSGCGSCASACPVNAITKKGIVKERCLSYLTQKKGELNSDTKNKIAESGCAWGCDICQKVCPHNKNVKITPIKAFFETARPVLTADSSIENRAFAWRGKAVIERNLKILDRRNVK